MAEWWQSPRYLEREAAGEVVTPGLVDWGGIVNAFNAPYNERNGRLPDGPMPPRSGNTVTMYYNAGNMPGGVAPKTDRYDPAKDDPANLFMYSGYAAKPRFVAPGISPSPKVEIPNQYPGPTPVAKTQDRLAPSPAALQLNGEVPQPVAPRMPYGLPTLKSGNPRAAYSAADSYAAKTPKMKFGSANAMGDGITRLTSEPMSETSGQNLANSVGGPVQGPSGTIYYPTNGATGKVRAPMSPVAERPQQQRQGGLGGLLGQMFGGGNGGGLFGGNAFQRPAGTPAITGPGGGGAFVSSASSQPASSPLSGVGGENSLLPAALNNSRWTTGY